MGIVLVLFKDVKYLLPLLWIWVGLLPDKVYTNGIERLGGFYYWNEIARLESEDENSYKIVLKMGRSLYIKLNDGDILPSAANIYK